MRTLLMLAAIGACGDDGGIAPDARVVLDAPADAPTPQKQAIVAILEDKPSNMTLWLGAFGTSLSIELDSRDEGPCQITHSMNGSNQRVSAGTLTVSGGSAATVTMPFDPMGYTSMASGLVYGGNDQLTFSASGATVPAFSGQLVFPSLVTVTSGTPTVLRLSGFTATWDATTSPVVILINQYPSSAPGLHVSCTFDGAAGTGTVPAAALTDVMTTVSVSIAIETQTTATVMAGEYPVELLVIYAALVRAGVPVQP